MEILEIELDGTPQKIQLLLNALLKYTLYYCFLYFTKGYSIQFQNILFA